MVYTREKKKEYMRVYYLKHGAKTRETTAISNWIKRGVKTKNLKDIYHKKYIPATHCEACNKEFINTRDRCLDHDHTTGKFRQIICQKCNNRDNWRYVYIPQLV
tara:strand:- start:139 stop:450 length:312 start_codon:yes stop_codon:yes gene_type:complete